MSSSSPQAYARTIISMAQLSMSPWMSSPTANIDRIEQESLLMEMMRSLAQSLSLTTWTRSKFKLVDEVPHLPTVVFDLDGTLIHTLVDPVAIAAAQQSDLKTIRLPGTMGLVVQRPGLEQLFSSLHGYNVVVYSAGGSHYVHAVVEHLVENNPSLQGKICKILCRPDLVRYTELSEVPCDTPLKDGVYYVKDLRKARADGNSQKVLIVDDNPYAFQVEPHMKDADFKRIYDFSLNAVMVPDFVATDPEAELDAAFARVGQLLEDIAGMEDTLAALKDHVDLRSRRRRRTARLTERNIVFGHQISI